MVAEVELRPLRVQGELTLGQPTTTAAAAPARSFIGRHLLFITTVVIPVFFAGLYLFVIAAPRYASESSFIVRSTDDNSALANLASMIGSSGASRAIDETYAINEYLTSRDIVDLLAANNNLREILSRPGADFIARFPTSWLPDNREWLYQRFQWMVSAKIDDSTGISTIEVNAFTPEDARAMTVALLGYAEALVNKLNERAYQDALNVANHFVDMAMADVRNAEKELSAYRNSAGMVDPGTESDLTLKIIETLSIDLARTEAAISEQAALAPHSPQTEALRQQARSYEQEIARRRLEIAGADASAASKLGKFEELVLKRELAAKSLENTVASRDKAREDVTRQHLYVQVISEPNNPDIARYPRAILGLPAVAAIALLVFFVLRGFRDVTLEHQT